MIAQTLDAIQKATCYVDYQNIAGTQKWTLTGSAEAVQAKVDALLRQFPAEGYGTTVDRHADKVVVTAYSCD